MMEIAEKQHRGGAIAAALGCTPAPSRHFAARRGGTLMLATGGVGKVGGREGWGCERVGNETL